MRSIRVLAILILVLVFLTSACSRGIDKRFVGKYLDEKNPKNSIVITEKNLVTVEAGLYRQFWGTSDGGTISLKVVSDMAPQVSAGYPEFQGSTATLIGDGDTLVTQSGRRFSRQ